MSVARKRILCALDTPDLETATALETLKITSTATRIQKGRAFRYFIY